MTVPFHAPERFYRKYKSLVDETVANILLSGHYFNSEKTIEFETLLARYCNRKYAISVGSCTDALYFSLIAAGIVPGDKILIPSVSFIATASAVLAAGGIPVFADIDPATGLVDLNHAEKLLSSSQIKAFIPVDLYGNMVDPAGITYLQNKFSVPVITDAAQSLGSHCKAIRAGRTGTLSCFSFDPTKIIHAFGSGGVVLTDDEIMSRQIQSLRYHGKSGKDFIQAGYNSRLDAIKTALLILQMEHIDEIIEDRRRTADFYFTEFNQMQTIECIGPGNTYSNYHKFVLKSKFRSQFRHALSEKGISTMIHYEKALYQNKLFEKNTFHANNIIHADAFCNEVFSIPLLNFMSHQEKETVADAVKTFKP